MLRYRLRANADRRLDDIADYTRRRWGASQAATYLEELFAQFDKIAAREVPWTRLPESTGIHGYRRQWRSHVIYWKEDSLGVAIVSVLHERMDQLARLQDDLAEQ